MFMGFAQRAKRIWPGIPEEERERFNDLACFNNVIRMRVMCWVSVAVMASMVVVQSLMPEGHALSKGLLIFFFMRLVLVGGSLAFLVAAPRPASWQGVTRRHRLAVPLGVAAMCALAGVWVGVIQQWTPVITFYLVMVFVMSALVNLAPAVSAVSLGLGLSALWIFVSHFQTDHVIRSYHLINGTVLTVLAFVVGQLNRMSSVLRFHDMLTIERQARELERLSLKDDLTGLANRRRMEQTLSEEWSRAGRKGRPLSLIMIDIDHFKAYNDTFGHGGGDDCLRDVARAIGACAQRAGELAARYGGEEFLVILPESDSAEAERAGQFLAQAVWDLNRPHPGSEHGRVTVSLGLATAYCHPDRDPRYLLDAADRALYKAKEQGRNRLVVARDRLVE